MELTLRHPFAYPILEPVYLTTPKTFATRSERNIPADDADWASSSSQLSSPAPAFQPMTAVEQSDSRYFLPSDPLSPQRETWPPSPLQPNGYYDHRLQAVKIGQWSCVPVDDIHAAAAISLYLEFEHPLFGFFDPDFFLDDLIAGRSSRFCSALLVNSLLYRAFVSYQRGLPMIFI